MSQPICFTRVLAVLVCLAALTGPASAQRRLPRMIDTPTFSTPQFRVEAITFRAVDESGPDWAGSDEVYFVFSAGAPTDKITAVYEDLDSGEARNLGARDSCVAPVASCATAGTRAVHVDLAMFERDLCGFVNGDLPNAHYVLRHGYCAGDDLIGRATIAYSEQQLLRWLRRPGASLQRTVTLGGPCGHSEPGEICATAPTIPSGPEYTLSYRITRLDDHISTPGDLTLAQ